MHPLQKAAGQPSQTTRRPPSPHHLHCSSVPSGSLAISPLLTNLSHFLQISTFSSGCLATVPELYGLSCLPQAVQDTLSRHEVSMRAGRESSISSLTANKE